MFGNDRRSVESLFKNKDFIVFVEERGRVEAKTYRLEKRIRDLHFASPEDLIAKVEETVEAFRDQGKVVHVTVDESGIDVFAHDPGADDGEVVGWSVEVRLEPKSAEKIREIFGDKRWLSFTNRRGRLVDGAYYGEDWSKDKYIDAEDLIGTVEETLELLVREKEVHVDVDVDEGEVRIVAYTPGTWDGEEFSWTLEDLEEEEEEEEDRA
jgi:arginase family enzyme